MTFHSIVPHGPPPRLTTGPKQTRQIAEVTLERLRPVGVDGLVLYDIDDESDRNPDERPFPFLPTMDPAEYLARDLAGLDVPSRRPTIKRSRRPSS